MTDTRPRHAITLKKVVYETPGIDAVTVQRDIAYHATDAGPLTMDIYYPPGATAGSPLPVVVIVLGYSDVGYESFAGCKVKEAEFCIGWARLIAASGMAAIAYTNREPVADARALLSCLRANAAALGLDASRLGLYATSGNGPMALSLLMLEGDSLRCAALFCPYTMDLDGATGVAEATKQWRFANPNEGKSVKDLPPDLPLFVARAGRDEMPNLNDALDRFVAHALARNLPMTIVNHATGPHAFDLMDDSDTTREVIRQCLAFLRFQLRA